MYENYSVLFVDDEVNILNSLRRGLMDEEFTCYFAESGKEALAIIDKKEIHVIVSDMRMPEMNGLELLKIVAEKSPLTVKLVLSGYTQLPQILVTINQVDIFKFITKPWNLEEFSAVIRKSLDYYIVQEENANYKKILETKNIAYQNILKKIDEVIYNAKKSSEILGKCGKAIIGFGKKFSLEEKIKYQSIFFMQDELFEVLSNAITNEMKDYDSNELEQLIKAHMLRTYPDVKFDKKSEVNNRVRVNLRMLEASITAIIVIFADEFKTHGFFPNILIDKKVKLSIISPNIDKKNEFTILDVKIDFIKSILVETLSMCQITLQITKVNGNLVIGIGTQE